MFQGVFPFIGKTMEKTSVKTPEKAPVLDDIEGFTRCEARYTRNKDKSERRLIYAKDYGRKYWIFPKRSKKTKTTKH